MSFTDAVASALRQYATFSGRARRSEYWWFALFHVAAVFAGSMVDAMLGVSPETGLFGTLALLALILPNLAVTARRLHDTGRSGWWMLIAFVPLAGGIAMLVFTLSDSTPGPNQYGPSPKYPQAQPGYYPQAMPGQQPGQQPYGQPYGYGQPQQYGNYPPPPPGATPQQYPDGSFPQQPQ